LAETSHLPIPERYAALFDAARLVAAGATQGLDATLDALVAQARRVFGAADATINLRDASGTFVRYRASALVPRGHALAEVGVPATLTPLTSLVLQTKHAAGVDDVAADPRIGREINEAFRGAPSALVAPLVADDDVLGMLVIRWTESRSVSAEDRALADALGQHAGIAVRTARLLEQRAQASAAALEHARRDGALDTAQTVVHRLGNSLSGLLVNTELIETRTEGEIKTLAAAAVLAAWRAAETVNHLRALISEARRPGSGWGRNRSADPDAGEDQRTG
jgi:GAF domain-containing protein